MGQYRHHVFVCTSGKTCPLARRIVDEHLVAGNIVTEYLHIAPPGHNNIETPANGI